MRSRAASMSLNVTTQISIYCEETSGNVFDVGRGAAGPHALIDADGPALRPTLPNDSAQGSRVPAE